MLPPEDSLDRLSRTLLTACRALLPLINRLVQSPQDCLPQLRDLAPLEVTFTRPRAFGRHTWLRFR